MQVIRFYTVVTYFMATTNKMENFNTSLLLIPGIPPQVIFPFFAWIKR